MTHFADSLAAAVRRCGNPVLVGLDPRAESLPRSLLAAARNDWTATAAAYRTFCREVIDVVTEHGGVVVAALSLVYRGSAALNFGVPTESLVNVGGGQPRHWASPMSAGA